jgi:hypothetical protein
VSGVVIGTKLAFDAAAPHLGSMDKLFGPERPGGAVIVQIGVGMVIYGLLIASLPWPEMVPSIRRVSARISRVLSGTIAQESTWHRRRTADPGEEAARIEAGDTSIFEDYVMAYLAIGTVPFWLPIYIVQRRRNR